MGRLKSSLTQWELDALHRKLVECYGNVGVFVNFAKGELTKALKLLADADASVGAGACFEDSPFYRQKMALHLAFGHLSDVWLGDYKKEYEELFEQIEPKEPGKWDAR